MAFTQKTVMMSEQTSSYYDKATIEDLDVAILTQDLEAEVLSSITIANNIDQDINTEAESTNCDEQCIEGATSITSTTHNDVVVPLDLNHIKSCGNTGATEVEILQEKNISDSHPLQLNDFYSKFRMYGFDNLTDTASHTKSGNDGPTGYEDSLGYQNSITPTEKQDEVPNDKLAGSVIETHNSKETHSSMVSQSYDATLQDLPRDQSSTETGSAKVYGMMTCHWSVRDIRKPLQKQVRRRATSGEPAGTTGRKGQGSCGEEDGSSATLPRWPLPKEDMETGQRVVGRSTSERCGNHTLPRSGRRHTVPRAVQPPSLEHHASLMTLTTDKLTWSQL